jgi:hypothetical protein
VADYGIGVHGGDCRRRRAGEQAESGLRRRHGCK